VLRVPLILSLPLAIACCSPLGAVTASAQALTDAPQAMTGSAEAVTDLAQALTGSAEAVADSADALTDSAQALTGSVQASQIEEILLALRSTDKVQLLQTLQCIPQTQGYPASGDALLPALLWIKYHQDDDDIVREASFQVDVLGWPQHYCLACMRRFASREDLAYKMMGVTALTWIAWKDPEAMAILFEITKNTHQELGIMVRSVSSQLQHIDCGNQYEMDDWNKRALPFIGRMENALDGANWHLRPLAAVLLNCPYLDEGLQRALQDYLDRVPEPLYRPSPTPDTHVFE
jgi:hypothetical protein